MNLKNNILITGVGGFIGLRAAEIAIKRGMNVCGLESDPEKAKAAANLGVQVTNGSVKNQEVTQAACQGVDLVLHTEEIAAEGGAIDQFREVNVAGTINIAKAAQNAGVKTFVHLSNALVYGFDYPEGVTETAQLTPQENPYCQTKIEAELALLQLNCPPDFGIIIIRPGDVYGPGSIPWVVRPLQLMGQKLFAYVNDGQGVINHLYVDNLIDAIFLAIEKQCYGEIFNITDGQQTSWKDYFTSLAEIGDFPVPSSLPKAELKGFLQIRYQGQKLFRKKPDIFPDAVDFMSRSYSYSIDKARKVLGYEPAINLSAGMDQTREWLMKNAAVKK